MHAPSCLFASTATAEIYTLSLHDALPIFTQRRLLEDIGATVLTPELRTHKITASHIEVFEAPYELVKTMRASVLRKLLRSEEHTSELQSLAYLVCRLLLEKNNLVGR